MQPSQPQLSLAERIWTELMGKDLAQFRPTVSSSLELTIANSLHGMFGGAPHHAEAVADVMKSVALVRDTLATHAHLDPKIGMMVTQFAQQGTALPSEEMLKDAQKLIAKHIHPDVAGTGNHAVFSKFNQSLETLVNPVNRQNYETIALSKRAPTGKAAAMLDGLAGKAWSMEIGSGMAESRILRLAGPATQEGMSWASRFSTPSKIGLAFAAVGATALAGYYLTRGQEQQQGAQLQR